MTPKIICCDRCGKIRHPQHVRGVMGECVVCIDCWWTFMADDGYSNMFERFMDDGSTDLASKTLIMWILNEL